MLAPQGVRSPLGHQSVNKIFILSREESESRAPGRSQQGVIIIRVSEEQLFGAGIKTFSIRLANPSEAITRAASAYLGPRGVKNARERSIIALSVRVGGQQRHPH
jgi:hypothetical protein